MKKIKKNKLFIFLCSGIGVLLTFLLILFCWWYGYAPEWGKSIKDKTQSEFYQILFEIYNTPNAKISENTVYHSLKKELSKMTTQVLVDIYAWQHTGISVFSSSDFYNFRSYYPEKTIEEMDQDTDYSCLLVSELLKRHNTGRILMKAYQDVPLTYPYTDYLGNERWTWNDNGSNFLEMILVQQEVQNHLTPWEKKDLMNLADEKQQEKFADPRYPISSAKHNYLYTDTYGYRNQDIFGKDYKEDFGWLEEKVEERAKPFAHLRLPILTGMIEAESTGYYNREMLSTEIYNGLVQVYYIGN